MLLFKEQHSEHIKVKMEATSYDVHFTIDGRSFNVEVFMGRRERSLFGVGSVRRSLGSSYELWRSDFFFLRAPRCQRTRHREANGYSDDRPTAHFGHDFHSDRALWHRHTRSIG